jgi:hypothetical protein
MLENDLSVGAKNLIQCAESMIDKATNYVLKLEMYLS